MNKKPIAWEKRLNPEQLEAVRHKDGPMLILAGAGSGKTRVIVHRIAYLITQHKVDARRILAVSFTNKAAEEMRGRISDLIGKRSGLTVSTFHSLCVRMLRRDIDKIGRKSNFTIYDGDEQFGLYKQLLRNANQDDSNATVYGVQSLISNAKNQGQDPKAFAKTIPAKGDGFKRMAAEIYVEYQSSLESFNALDFDDLLMQAVRLLKSVPEVGDHWAARFEQVMVDEYQDTNGIQLDLLKLICGRRRNLTVVGDDDQAIYGWRGADVRNILDFEEHFAPCKVVNVDQNYRSTNNILETANHIIENNHQRRPKRLWSSLGGGPPVEIHALEDDESEAQWIAQTVRERLAEYGEYNDFAVLYRTNSQSRILEDAFRYARIPYRIIGGMRFYDRKEVRDFVAYLKTIVNPDDEISLLRILNVPPRGIGKTTIQRLNGICADEKINLWTLFSRLDEGEWPITPKARHACVAFWNNLKALHDRLESSGAGELAEEVEKTFGLINEVKRLESDPEKAMMRADNMRELIDSIYRFEEDAEEDRHRLGDYLERVALIENHQDKKEDGNLNAVTLMTLHGAKGLEFPVVFMVGMEEELFPHRRSAEENRIDEERRLCYVGITRAQHRLYLSRPLTRFYYGRSQPRTPSRFLAELPEDKERVIRYDWTDTGAGEAVDPETLAANFFKQYLGEE